MKKVLFSNAIGPHELGWGEDMFDLFGARLTRGQGVFTLGGHIHAWPLYVIAENIPAHSLVLENPDEKVFKEEVKRGYDIVALQIKSIHTRKVKRMMEMVKEISPKTKIVIGGYGVMLLYDPPPHDPENCASYILDNADYICHEEGVGFFRKILGADVCAPIVQNNLPLCGMTLRGLEGLVQFNATGILVALGCPNACEFCCTSAFFKAKKIQVASPERCFEDLKSAYARIGNDVTIFNMIWDEDFVLDKEFLMKLGELIRAADMLDKINFFCFSSIKGLSQYTAEELALCGVGACWIGLESKFEEVVSSDHNIQKRVGRRPEEVIHELHCHGILVIASNILGFDFHTRENIEEDIDYFVSLKPDLYQVSPLTPCPGTVLYGRMKEMDRIYDKFSWEDLHLWKSDVFNVKNFEQDEIKNYFDLAHKKIFETNGPSILSLADVMLQGYRTLLHSPNPHLQKRADRFYYFAKKLGPALFYSIKKLCPSEAVQKRVNDVERRHIQLIGNLSWGEKIVSRYIVYPILKHKENQIEKYGNQNKSDPPWRKTYYHGDGSPSVVVKRRNALKWLRQKTTRNIVHHIIGLRQKPVHNIKLADIDDYASFNLKTVEIDGDFMNYVDEGKGEVLLMLHGNPTWSYLYRHFIKEFRKDYRCIAIDHLGYGLSDKPPNADYSIEAHIRRLGKVIDKLGLKDITLICQDWGGIIGLSYAARNKEKFKRLIPMNTTGFLPEKLGEFIKCAKGAWAFPYLWTFKIPVFGKKMGMDWNIFLKVAMRFGVYNSKRQIHKKAWLGYLYPFQRVVDRIAILKSVRQIPILPRGPIWRLLRGTGDLLRGWDIKTQIIWGIKDKVFVPWFVDKMEELLPNHVDTLRIPTASHFLQDDEPEIIIDQIKKFLSDQKGAATDDQGKRSKGDNIKAV